MNIFKEVENFGLELNLEQMPQTLHPQKEHDSSLQMIYFTLMEKFVSQIWLR